VTVVGFEPSVSAIEGQQNYLLDGTATWLCKKGCAQLLGHYQLIFSLHRIVYSAWVLISGDPWQWQSGKHRFCVLDIIQGVSRLVDITAGGDFLGLCDQKSSHKHVSDFGRLRSYGHFLIPVHAFV
jgi:hypothetical protein